MAIKIYELNDSFVMKTARRLYLNLSNFFLISMFKKLAGAYEYQAYRLLQLVFFIVSIGKGIDKIIYFWTGSVILNSPFAILFFTGNNRQFVVAVGIVEVILGIGVLFRPKFFAYVLMIWFSVILISFIALEKYFDIAVRDFGLILAAFALTRLCHKYSN
jgi:hypothetical protein